MFQNSYAQEIVNKELLAVDLLLDDYEGNKNKLGFDDTSINRRARAQYDRYAMMQKTPKNKIINVDYEKIRSWAPELLDVYKSKLK
eukprot:Pgem_evm1s6368